MKKKIVIIYATYGSGHKAIANYIDSYLTSVDKDYEILKIDLLDYAMPYIGRISKVVNEFFMLRMPFVHNAVYQTSNYELSGRISSKISMNLFKNKKLRDKIAEFNPDIAICTHFFGAELIKSYEKKKLIKPIIVSIITDYDPHVFWINHPRKQDYYIVAADSLIKPLLDFGLDRKQIKSYGIPINPIVTNSFDVLKFKRKYHFDNDKLTCVFFGGGGNGSLASLAYLKMMVHDELDLNIIYITGKNERCRKKAESLVREYNATNVKVLGFANNVPELLQISDFVITKPGGVQVTECLYFKKPMILINSSGGQENANYRFLEENGYGKMFRTHFFFEIFLRKVVRDPSNILKLRSNFNKNKAETSMEKLHYLIEEIYSKKKK